MSRAVIDIFIVILFLLLASSWVVTGGLIAQATHKLKDYKDDTDLSDAYWYCFWATFVTWFLVGIIFILGVLLLVVGVPLAVVFAPEEAAALAVSAKSGLSSGVAIIFTLLLLAAAAMLTLNGVLATLALRAILSSTEWDPTNEDLQKAKRDTLITSVVSLGSVAFIIILFVSYIVAKLARRKWTRSLEKK